MAQILPHQQLGTAARGNLSETERGNGFIGRAPGK
jgi:hypothetical protein